MADFPLYDEFGDPVRSKDGTPITVSDSDQIVSSGIAKLEDARNWVQNEISGVANELNLGDGLPKLGEFPQIVAGDTVFPIDDATKTINAAVQGINLESNNIDINSFKENLEDAGLQNLGGALSNIGSTIKATATSINNNQAKPVLSQTLLNENEKKNILHGLASYTYNFELYILTYDDYNNFVNNPKFQIEKSPQRLLIKSGGGNYGVRNPYFMNDFYMDDLEIDSVISPGGANKGAVNTGVSFKITEPYGMTLLNSLVLAANHFGSYNYIEQPYLLKVFVTGYDSYGKPVGSRNSIGQRTRYIPIRFTDFKFGVTEQGTTYDVTAVPYNSMGVQSTATTIPVDIQIEAKTVHDFFNVALRIDNGDMRPNGPPNQPMVPLKQLEKGLVGYLNKLEDDHVEAKLKAIPDIYSFEIDPDIANSKIVTQEAVDLAKTANTNDPGKVAQQRFTENFIFDETTKTYSIRAGTSIIQTIHSILRSSEYMTDQVISADLKKQKDSGVEGYEDVDNKPIDFYRIVPRITLGPFDKIRNQYAKFITFVIKKYQMHGKDFENLGQKPVEYISKYYDYFFTGNNQDILSFDIDFNAAYFQTYTYNQMEKAGSLATPLAQTKLNEAIHEGQTAKAGNDPIAKWTPYVRNVVTQTATSNDINDPSASHKSVTIDNFMQNVFDQGADLLQMNMRIVGDMSYIQTKDFRSVLVQDNLDYRLPDGSLNTDKEWHIYVKFRNPTDLDASTGLMKGFNVDETGKTSVNTPSISGEYKVIKVTSNFSNGQFTQNLECVRERKQPLNTIDKKEKTSTERTNVYQDAILRTATKKKVNVKGNKIGTGLTGEQRNALSSMGDYKKASAYEYTPNNYTTATERGQLENMDVNTTDGPEAVGQEWNPKPGTVVTPAEVNTVVTPADKFLNDQNQEEIEFDIELNEGTT